jgi:hypothetical protein
VIGIISSDLDSEFTPSLHDTLTKTSIASSYAKITVHPLALGRSLQSTYGLPLHLHDFDQEPRIYTFLRKFYTTGWGGHGFRSAEADEYEMDCILDGLSSSKAGRRCLIEWERRGVAQDKGKGSQTERGLAGVIAIEESLQVVLLGEVLPAARSKPISTVSSIYFILHA